MTDTALKLVVTNLRVIVDNNQGPKRFPLAQQTLMVVERMANALGDWRPGHDTAWEQRHAGTIAQARLVIVEGRTEADRAIWRALEKGGS